MLSASVYIPGADNPAKITQAARKRRILQCARRSESVVNLLCDLAFGPHPDIGWAPVTHSTFPEVVANG